MEKAHQSIVRIREMQNGIVERWSMDVEQKIQFSVSQFLLVRIDKGLLKSNFDESVSWLLRLLLYLCVEEMTEKMC